MNRDSTSKERGDEPLARPDPMGAARAEVDATGVQPVPAASPGEASGERPGDWIGRYRLVEEVGEGGMGSVWLAEQEEPVKRRVALKLIKLGMDTKEVVVRFEAERQALALMDHPHIAKVFDGGATESGRPYFVMELVDGVPITDYCASAGLGLRERLELFTRVCEAVQHAHQKGVIHRDLKPGNVLVALHDRVPVPKVIDFGIAKATSAELTQKTMFTQHAQMIGTPEYMAPEQAGLSALDIDTRADVYSLGVLLYELLTGTKPFDIREVLERGYEELLRTIREAEPARPSTRVSTLGQKATPEALGRQVNVDSLSKRLRGDLDWVVMKALEKDRSRRYETASGLASDIGRFLRDEPVLAAPPSTAYRLRKFVRRRKKTVAAGLAFAILLIAGSVGTGVGWWKASEANAELAIALDQKAGALAEEERQRDRADQNAKEATENARQAREAERQAQQRADELERVVRYQSEQIQGIDAAAMGAGMQGGLLAAAAPQNRAALEAGLDGINFTNLALAVVKAAIFDRSLGIIERDFADQALVQAQLFQALGNAATEIGMFDFAVEPTRRALDLRVQASGEEDLDAMASLETLGRLHHLRGEFAESEAILRESLARHRRARGDEDPSTLTSAANLAMLLRDMGKLEEAELLHREAAAGFAATVGDDHDFALANLNNLALLLQSQGRLGEATELLRRVLLGHIRLFGEEDPATVSVKSNLGLMLWESKQLEEAESLFREALAASRRLQGDDHPATLVDMNNLALVLDDRGNDDEALALYEEALVGLRRVHGTDHLFTLSVIQNVATQYSARGDLERALPLIREAAHGNRTVLGEHHLNTIGSTMLLGEYLARSGSHEEGLHWLRVAIPDARHYLGPEHPFTVRIARTLAVLLDSRSRAGLEVGARRAAELAELGDAYLLLSKPAEAEGALAEAVQLFAEAGLEASPATWMAQSDLAEALARQGRPADAEHLLVASATRMLEAAEAVGEAQVLEALRRLVGALEAREAAEPNGGHAARAAEWRRVLEERAGSAR